MSPSNNADRPALAAAAEAGGFLATVAAIVAGAILVVPVGAFFLARWVAGTLFDALRPGRNRE